jgi:acetyltransferase-like isoleucine patch superfamily enzyme
MVQFIRRGFRFIRSLPKTLYFNFHYLPFKQACTLPIFVDAGARLISCKGRVELAFKPSRFCIKIGGSDEVILNKKGNGLRWKSNGTVIFEGPAKIGYGCGISVEKDALLKFGDRVFFNVGNLIICTKGIEFGKRLSVAWGCTFIDSDFHDIVEESTGLVINPDRNILIGDYVWIGYDSKIGKGVSIGNWNIIGANSVVNKSISGERQIWAGAPAKLVKTGYSRPSLSHNPGEPKIYR